MSVWVRAAQWCSVGFWRPGQEVELVPLFLIFSSKFSKMVDPKQILVIFKREKKKEEEEKKGHEFVACFSYIYESLYTFH